MGGGFFQIVLKHADCQMWKLEELAGEGLGDPGVSWGTMEDVMGSWGVLPHFLCICASTRISQESQRIPYAGFSLNWPTGPIQS